MTRIERYKPPHTGTLRTMGKFFRKNELTLDQLAEIEFLPDSRSLDKKRKHKSISKLEDKEKNIIFCPTCGKIPIFIAKNVVEN